MKISEKVPVVEYPECLIGREITIAPELLCELINASRDMIGVILNVEMLRKFLFKNPPNDAGQRPAYFDLLYILTELPDDVSIPLEKINHKTFRFI